MDDEAVVIYTVDYYSALRKMQVSEDPDITEVGKLIRDNGQISREERWNAGEAKKWNQMIRNFKILTMYNTSTTLKSQDSRTIRENSMDPGVTA
ncbi:hypothetical protein STEG23_016254 [Scotinomys teguina]